MAATDVLEGAPARAAVRGHDAEASGLDVRTHLGGDTHGLGDQRGVCLARGVELPRPRGRAEEGVARDHAIGAGLLACEVCIELQLQVAPRLNGLTVDRAPGLVVDDDGEIGASVESIDLRTDMQRRIEREIEVDGQFRTGDAINLGWERRRLRFQQARDAIEPAVRIQPPEASRVFTMSVK